MSSTQSNTVPRSVHNLIVKYGFSEPDAMLLRRQAMRLKRWFTRVVNGDIARDETTDKPYQCSFQRNESQRRSAYHDNQPRTYIPDQEDGVIKIIERIMKKYPDYTYYIQDDPRGASLYIIDKMVIDTVPSKCYHHGIALYK